MEDKVNWLDEAIKREATPKTLREETVEQFCKRFDLPVSNYYYHISKPDNKKKVLETVISVAKDAAPEVLKRLVEKAEEGDMKAIDIYVDSILQLAKILDLQTAGKPLILPATLIVKNDTAQESGNSSPR